MSWLVTADSQLGDDVQGLGRALGRVPGHFVTTAAKGGLQLLSGRLYQCALAGLIGRSSPPTPLSNFLQLPLYSSSHAAVHTMEPLRDTAKSMCTAPVSFEGALSMKQKAQSSTGGRHQTSLCVYIYTRMPSMHLPFTADHTLWRVCDHRWSMP